MPELEAVLTELGRRVEFPPTPDLAPAVRRRLGESRSWRRLLVLALAVLVVAVAAALAVPAARRARPARRPAERRRFRASLATIWSSHGRNGEPRRKRPSARWALTKPSCAASSASAALPATRYAVRNAIP